MHCEDIISTLGHTMMYLGKMVDKTIEFVSNAPDVLMVSLRCTEKPPV